MSYTVSYAPQIITLNESDRGKSILQNISIILRTRRGSVPMYREFGIPRNFLDKPANVALPILIIEVREALAKFEPRAEFVSASFRHSNDGVLIPQVEVNIPDE